MAATGTPCVAWHARTERQVRNGIYCHTDALVIATEHGIGWFKSGNVEFGEGYVFGDFEPATWKLRPFLGGEPTFPLDNRLWEHHFVSNIEEWAEGHGVQVEQLDIQELHKVYAKFEMDTWMGESVAGHEGVYSSFVRLSGLIDDEEISAMVEMDEAAVKERVYMKDDTYGMF